MATIARKHGKYYVVYRYTDENGYQRQKWEGFKTSSEARKRKNEVEFQQDNGTLIVPKAIYVSEMLEEFVSIYGSNNWALSTYENRVVLIENYINPVLGDMKIENVTTRVIDNYYKNLQKTKTVTSRNNRTPKYITPRMIYEIHQLLRCAFNQAMKWEMIGKNPCKNASLPKSKPEEREIWDAETIFKAIELCDDDLMKLALNVAFAASLREGEMLGLTWDCVNISDEAIESGNAYVYIDKELQRVQTEALEKLNGKDVLFSFGAMEATSKTTLVLKTPKTDSSVRKVFIPRAVAEMLQKRKEEIRNYKHLFGEEYFDYKLVFCTPDGRPLSKTYITRGMDKLIKENNLPRVVFHSIRHSSITYKLKLTGGDMKAVQGDSGHSQLKMIADVYSHVIDEDRRKNAALMESAFYSTPEEKAEKELSKTNNAETDEQTLLRLLANPETAKLIKAIAGNL